MVLSSSAACAETAQTSTKGQTIPPDSVAVAQVPHVGAALLAEYWLPRAQLDAATRARLPSWCDGAYRRAKLAYPRGVDVAALPTEAEARKARYFIDDRLELAGEVVISRGNRTLRTESATLYEASERAELHGQVRIEAPGLVLLGDHAEIDMASESAQLDDVAYLLSDAGFRGNAAAVAQSEQGDLLITEGSVTRCDPGNNTWRIDARSLAIGEGAVFGTARGAVVRVKDVPVFYMPYMRFPVTDERQSGWLFPNIGYSGEDGFDFSAPYYFNLARNYDATLTPRILSKRGLALEGEMRHLNRYGSTVLGAALLRKDDLFNGALDRDDFTDVNPGGEFNKADRWLYAIDHRGRRGHFETLIDYTAVSDADYFRDLGTGLSVASRIELERRGELSYRRGNWDARLWAQRFQRLDEITTQAYQRLPQFDLSYSSQLLGPLQFNLSTQAVSFDRDNDDLAGIARIVGNRVHVQPELRLPFAWPFAFVELVGGYRYTRYDLRDVALGQDARPSRSIGYGSADGGLFFERDLNLFGTRMIQTLEPRLFYLYQESEDQALLPRFDVSRLTFSYNQLFRTNRFSGLDRIGDANQLSIGVSTALMNASSGRELLRASVGEIFYFRDRKVTLGGSVSDDDRQSSSAIAAQLRASIARHWRLSSTVVWDPHDNQIDESGFALGYRRGARRLLNLGYRNRRLERLDQTDVSILWPLGAKWGLLGRWNYDLKNDRTIDGFVGLEYNNCCWQFRVVARRFIENPSNLLIDQVRSDKGVFLQIVFKGLAGFGAKIDTMMARGIRGYNADDSTKF